jgi:glutamate-1-semialdehyde 2,1-aminomutase
MAEQGGAGGRERTAAILARARAAFAGGCLGTFALPDELAVIPARGQGSRLWDVDGREYIDYVMGSGPLILGHAHPAVVAAVAAEVAKGSHFYTPMNETALRLAERIVAACPCAETVKFVNSGAEATFTALRLARAFTGRDKVLKFEGGYHGHHDYAQMSFAPPVPREFPDALPDSAGIPAVLASQVLVAPFNDQDAVEKIVQGHRGELAAVIVEPLQREIPPRPGFLQALRAITSRYGVLLIFDEVVTGFRLAWGGAQERYGAVPDLAAYGKIIGGGYPLAAVAGRREILGLSDPARRREPDYVCITGTLNGSPVAAAAGLATLAELERPGSYEALQRKGNRLRAAVEEMGRRYGLPARGMGEGSIFVFHLANEEIRDYRTLQAYADRAFHQRFGAELIRNGIFVYPGQKNYISLAHSDADLDRTLEVYEAAFRTLTRAS